jgi:c-di-GMP-binding flagellar brake protein YcgR
MPANPIQVETSERLSRNLGLLEAGSSVIIQMSTPAGKKGKFRTCFIGYLPKNYILIQYPDSTKIGTFSQYIKPGMSVTVRGLIEGNEGAIVAFVSSIRQTLQTPSRLIVLEFPHKVTLQYLRSSMRIDTDISVKIGINKEFFNAKISDVSVSGCQLVVNNAASLMLANDKEIDIVIEDFGGKSNLKLVGMIRNIKKQGNDVSLGVLFSKDIKEKVVSVIQNTIVGDIN